MQRFRQVHNKFPEEDAEPAARGFADRDAIIISSATKIRAKIYSRFNKHCMWHIRVKYAKSGNIKDFFSGSEEHCLRMAREVLEYEAAQISLPQLPPVKRG